MSITNFSINKCQYSIQKLDNYVWLLPKESIGIIDDEYYVESSAKALQIKCYNVSLTSQESLDERFRFQHTLNFSILDYKNHSDFGDRYYAMVRDKNGNYWLVNLDFKLKFAYTFTIDNTNMHTDFTLTTDSNLPLMNIKRAAPWADANYTSGSTMYKWVDMEPASVITSTTQLNTFICDVDEEWQCENYNHCGIKELQINETRYTSLDENTSIALYSNDCFKVVDFIKNSATLTEQYDGEKIVHSVKFKIPFSDDTTWQNKLLEFKGNKYCVIASTSCGWKIATGFHYGLQPSYVINTASKEGNSIEITLQDLHNEGSFVYISNGITSSADTRVVWDWVASEYECLTNRTAKHLLEESFDIYGNKTYTYKCLEGYEEDYEYLGDKLIGTFPSGGSEVFNSGCDCFGTECEIQTDLATMTFTRSGETKNFSVYCNNSSWSLTSTASASDIEINPMNGNAGVHYNLSITCHKVPTSYVPTVKNLILQFCDGQTKNYNIAILKIPIENYFPQGDTYNVDMNQQTLRIPTTICIDSVVPSDSMIKDIQIQPTFITMTVENNAECSGRTATLTVTSCNDEIFTLTVNQEGIKCTDYLFEAHYSGGTTCSLPCSSTNVMSGNLFLEAGCEDSKYMTSVTIGDCCKTINPYAFAFCNNLSSITIGDMVQTIKHGAFYNVPLTSMTITAPIPPILYDALPASLTVINVPCESLAQYKAADGWRDRNTAITASCPTDHRIASGSVYCQGYDAYIDLYSQVSYDGGATWETTATTHTLLGKNSPFCGYNPPPAIDYTKEYLTFLTKEPCTFTFQGTADLFQPVVNFAQYSLDSGQTWTTLSSSAQTTPLIEANKRVMWKCDATPNSTIIGGGVGKFFSSGRFELEGNIMSILWGDNFIGKTDLKGSFVFFSTFANTSIVSAEHLIMPATALTQWCYAGMFTGCAVMEKAPVLSATTLVNRCYLGMFDQCSSLNYVKCLATNITADDCTNFWLRGVSPNGTFVKASSAFWGTCGDSTIPCGWQIQNA